LGLLGNFKIDRFQQVAGGVQNIHPPGTNLMGYVRQLAALTASEIRARSTPL
jgi:hypothetical protein